MSKPYHMLSIDKHTHDLIKRIKKEYHGCLITNKEAKNRIIKHFENMLFEDFTEIFTLKRD